jgi:hypothetical protein
MECALSRHVDDHRRWRRALARRLTRLWCALLLCAAADGILPTELHGAPPGAQRLDRGRFTVIHYAADQRLAKSVLEAAFTRDSFPALPRSASRILIMIAPDAATFREWAGQSDLPWAAAVAFVEQHRVVMQGSSASSDAGAPLQVLRHELAHVALFDFLGGINPRWFDEGYASYAAGEERTEGFLSTNSMLASGSGTEARAGYALALRAVSDLAAIDRRQGLTPLLTAWRERASFDLAMRRAYAQTAEDFEREWQQRTRWQFAFLAIVTNSAIGGLLLVAMLVPLHRSRRRRQRERLEEMRRREAVTEAAMRSAAVDAMLGAIRPAGRPGEPDA